jgi:thioredoxin reductase
MARPEVADVTIIGGGPAGLAAAAEAKGAGAERVILLERDDRVGGILNQQVHDGFGTKVFKEALTGPEYAAIYEDRVNEREVETWLKSTVIDPSSDRLITVRNDKRIQRIDSGSVIIATGCREWTRGAIGTVGTRPAGVYTAGAVQNYMNVRNLAVGRKVVILGSGDIGLIMARRLMLEGAEVVCVAVILPQPSGIAANIPLYLSTTVSEIDGKERVTGVTLANVGSKMGEIKGTRRFVECDTLLLSVGLIPETELAVAVGVNMSPATNGAIVDDSFRTSIPGIFSCGNVLQVHDVVDFATLESEKAGVAAAIWATTGKLPDPVITMNGRRGSALRAAGNSQRSGQRRFHDAPMEGRARQVSRVQERW